jgi:hypothetical protein
MPIDRGYAFVELSALQAPLGDIGYTVEIDEATATLRISRPPVGPESVVSVGLKPSPAEDIRLVECDARYLFEIDEDARAGLADSLAIINRHLPIGHLAADPDGAVHARWTIATDARIDLEQELVVTSIVLFDLLQQHFGDYVSEVCSGELDASLLETVMQQAGDAE